jgi:hypothetical protein
VGTPDGTARQDAAGRANRSPLTAVGALLADPLPAEAEPYPEVPDTFTLTTGLVTVFYRRIGEEIDIVYLRPNS